MTHAYALISRQGFKSVTIRQIPQEAGINEALIYRHFRSNAELLKTILTKKVKNQPVTLIRLPDSVESFFQQVSDFVGYFLETNRRDPGLIRAILYAVLEDYPLPDSFDLTSEGNFLNWLHRSIAKGQAEWGFDPSLDPIVVTSSFIGGLVYARLQSGVLKDTVLPGPEEFKSAYLRLFEAELLIDKGFPHPNPLPEGEGTPAPSPEASSSRRGAGRGWG